MFLVHIHLLEAIFLAIFAIALLGLGLLWLAAGVESLIYRLFKK